MKWQSKYVLQKLLSRVPLGIGLKINRSLSRHFGYLRDPPLWGLGNTLAMIALLERHGFEIEGKRCAELGTGWDGSAAMVLLSLGAESVYSFDLTRHLDDRLIAKSLAALSDPGRYLKNHYPFPVDLAAMAERIDPAAVELDRFRYHAPWDARKTSLADESIDLYFSSAVFEHVDAAIIPNLLAEAHRALKPGGITYHYVQPVMHASWFDPDATGVEFLAISDTAWRRWYQNDIAYENRLRAVEHVDLVRSAGFKIVDAITTIDRRDREALETMTVAPCFRGFTKDELAADYTWIVARKPV